jgi:ferric-dicitrate binding protein FerR (iron transport regulator)
MNDQSSLDERRWTLATRLLTGELTAAEKTELEAYLLDDAFRLQFETIGKNWETLGKLPYDKINVAADWAVVSQRIQAQRPALSFFTGNFLRYAAVIAIGLAVSFFVGRQFSTTGSDAATLMTVVEAPPGARTSVTLPDSTKVWLNANSRISFNASYGADNRHIVMEGEAFFDVVKSDIPFFIETPLYNVSVLGTAFNVKAYPDDSESSTTLVRGSLKVTRGNEEVILKPNEKVVVLKNAIGSGTNVLALEKNVDAALATAWKEGWLSVQSESLLERAKKIERLYDVRISFQDKELESYRYSGRIRQFSLEQVLKALSLTSPVEFTIQEKSVVLRENKNTRQKYESLKK